MRKMFDGELDSLREKLFYMVEQAQHSLKMAVSSLQQQDENLARKVIEEAPKIDELEYEINNDAIQLLAKQSPVASDLRRIVIAIKVSSDLERIGDLSENIARISLRIGDKQLVKPIEEIPKMAEVVQEMLLSSFKAFDAEDVRLAKEVAEKDDLVDAYYGNLVDELTMLMTTHQQDIHQLTQLQFVCRHIERIGDHITNICENIVYLVTGRMYELN
ncbi:phosphate signaling complex protein PhoU [Priestia endophytica]|jgi:phosphate transport system protein|uniref:Phosphate-specific transport system accessory protein PhoU n=1 Tax=Priestia endophytica DSM 13796 TaxID=1121089 RepID=A0A1I5WCK9_9BACI|nr:phosphate signaling complex protein PhoU [Priestia endophytica]KAB2493588.1 phosphate signaling complex protein PhoU [Priestia endophytica]KYG36079.1 PhoU family transcriptional regulator [Priestia endophytica]MBG9815020.1 PhoU family transcriptional regulator [Priestia endophytica]MCM3539613.1 phosphate signaling complex protein PhoU [Priestia endophytica]RAS81774.1 phosphate transport system regulatory protein PhoU [Priestia endophytica]